LEYSTRLSTALNPTNLGQGLREVADIETALDWAEVAAMLGDFREAISWLEYVEWLHGSLPSELAERRVTWACAAGLDSP
jgi:hypothetical protein